MDEQKKDVGAIWERTSKKGVKYFSIKIGDAEYVAFSNSKDGNDKRPDWRIYPSEKLGESAPKPTPSSGFDDRVPF